VLSLQVIEALDSLLNSDRVSLKGNEVRNYAMIINAITNERKLLLEMQERMSEAASCSPPRVRPVPKASTSDQAGEQVESA